MKIADTEAREQALDTQQSFIVQAPAGSGKTELLTQRFLALLGHAVSNPEEIVAITFTRKAALEMRERIISAIHSAKQAEPEAAHKKTTWALARQVLTQNQTFAWQLLENPNRLKITTIDSFCRSIAGQLPILSHMGSQTNISDNPYKLYHKAAQYTLRHLKKDDPWQKPLKELLVSVDNDYERAESLIVAMLSTREQWLNYIGIPQEKALAHLTQSLENIISNTLENIYSLMTPLINDSMLVSVLHFAASHKGLSLPHYATYPAPTVEHIEFWQFVAELFVTSKGEPRKNVDKRMGFPAATSSKNKSEKVLFNEMKNAMKILLSATAEQKELITHLGELQSIPSPSYYHENNKEEKIFSLFHVMELAYAELRLVFNQHNCVDFTEISLSANTALQHSDSIEEINLILDYKLKHLLIDEFQDTSRLQFSLLESLTREWMPDDEKTLFLVGDPMQSIYRFRQAEVGLFIQVQQLGINHIDIQPLTLSCNFRSDGRIIDWINAQFVSAFPAKSNIASGAIHYSPSIPVHQRNSSRCIHWHIHDAESTALDRTINMTKVLQTILDNNPKANIAILARKRKHLLSMVQVLNAFKIPYSAIDIESLMEKPLIHDLIALTAALHHLGDKLAWLSILRMPAIALSLQDVLLIAENTHERTILQTLNDKAIIANLSAHAKHIINRILPILNLVIKEKARFRLRQLIQHSFEILGGLDALLSINEHNIYYKFLSLLDEWDNEFVDYHTLRNALESEFASTPHGQSNVQLMTIHKSKGLEFDYVILPELHDKGQNDTAHILAWHEQPTYHHTHNHQYDWLLAPKKAIGDEDDKMYQLIRKIHQDKSYYETTRILYVAATRAKKALHLSYQQLPEEKSTPAKDSLLYALWDNHLLLGCQIHQHEITDNKINRETQTTYAVLPENWQASPDIFIHGSNDEISNEDFVFDFSWDIEQKIGSIYHLSLKLLAENPQLIAKDFALLEDKIAYFLHSHFVPDEIHSEQQNSIISTLKQVCQDKKGHWILHQTKDARAEYPVSMVEKDTIKHYIIDRTFVDEHNTRWVIDYKTTLMVYNNPIGFFESEWEKYHQQLTTYAHYFALREDREIKLGLYYPRQQLWFEKVYQHARSIKQ